MNVYVADRIARDHADQLLADAVIARRIRAARRQRVRAAHGVQHAATSAYHAAASADRAATTVEHIATTAAMTAARARPTSRARAAVSRAVTRPYAAFHAWLSAGLL